MSIDNTVTSLLAAASAAYSQAETGLNLGERPKEDGVYDCFLTGINVTSGKFKEAPKGADKEPLLLDCVEITFEYERIWNPREPDFNPATPSTTFIGERRQILTEAASQRLRYDGSRTRARIAMEQVKTALSRILNKDPKECVNLMADIQAVDALTKADSRVALSVRVAWRVDGANRYFGESVIENISRAT
jgi:hypothetical protein